MGHGSFFKDFAEDVYAVEETDEAPVEAAEVEEVAEECNSVKEFCEFELDPEYLLRYRLNVPQGSSIADCAGCTASMELVYEGEAWVSLAFTNDGKMIGGEAVIGIPGEGVLK